MANANVGGDRWRRRHDAVLSVIKSELEAASQDVLDNVYGLVESRFGDGSHAAISRIRTWGSEQCGEGDRRRRRRQGVVPDMLIESAVNDMTTVVGARTLFELKQINFLVHVDNVPRGPSAPSSQKDTVVERTAVCEEF